MHSFVILMIEAEQPEGISSRKLVVETAKHNVLTAYDPTSGLELLQRFPNVDAILLHSGVIDTDSSILERVRHLTPGIPIIVACPHPGDSYRGADFIVESHRPQQLLDLLSKQFDLARGTD